MNKKIYNKKSAVDKKEILLRTCSPESISKQTENLQVFSSRCLQCGFARAALTDQEKTERKVWKNRISVEDSTPGEKEREREMSKQKRSVDGRRTDYRRSSVRHIAVRISIFLKGRQFLFVAKVAIIHTEMQKKMAIFFPKKIQPNIEI